MANSIPPESRLGKLLKIAANAPPIDDPAHDFAHVMRVFENAKLIGTRESANLDILLPAALLHDLINLPKNHPERAQAAQFSAKESQKLLEPLGYTAVEMDHIARVIEEHSFSGGKHPSSLEGAILQDADRLDAIGAIGIMRCVSTGTKMGSRFFNPALLTHWASSQSTLSYSGPQLDDRMYMVDHFFEKLLKLKNGFHTQAARKMAEDKSHFLIKFLDQLRSEITPS